MKCILESEIKVKPELNIQLSQDDWFSSLKILTTCDLTIITQITSF